MAEESAAEIAASLETGDHWQRQQWKDGARLLLLLARGLTRGRAGVPLEPPPKCAVIVVAANPVAHGARLIAATGTALKSLDPVLAVDVRLAAPAALVPFGRVINLPSLALSSLLPWVTRAVMLDGLRLWWASRRLRRVSQRRVSGSTWAFLLVGQSIRYQLVASLMNQVRPAAVITDFDRAAVCRPWIAAARRCGVPALTLVHGAPTEDTYVPLTADVVCAWSHRQSAWWDKHAEGGRAAVVGRVDLEREPDRRAPTRSARRALLLHSSERLSASERERLMDLVQALVARGVCVVIRVHPSVRLDGLSGGWADLQRAGALLSSARVGPLADELRDTDLVLGVASTALLDATWRGLPAALVADEARILPVDLEPLRGSGDELWGAMSRGDEWWTWWLEHVAAGQRPAWTVVGEEARARLLGVVRTALTSRGEA